MSRIATAFSTLKASGKKAYIGYVMAGFPGEAASLELGRKLLASGADLLEVGVPFSDPIADGAVIQKAADLALKAGGSLAMSQRVLAALRRPATVASSRASKVLRSPVTPATETT